ncbi:MAG: folate family ECF transporter S component [Oscillospiraceae bacterium]|nr:folate family ECF transporter S component [Oscillospiraceae bacterium]
MFDIQGDTRYNLCICVSKPKPKPKEVLKINKVLFFFGADKAALERLKKPTNICVIGLFIAIYVLLERFSFIPVPWLKINFGFLALMSIAMLFGPFTAVIAAIPCDILGAMSLGNAIQLQFTPVAMIEALIYGVFIYKNALGGNPVSFGIFMNIGRLVAIIICNIFLNTWLLYELGYLSQSQGLWFQVGARVMKNAAEYALDAVLMPMVLIPVRLYYKRIFERGTHIA